jgi:dienelactone hydrolase
VISAAWTGRVAATVVLAALALVCGCAGHPQPGTTTPATQGTTRPATRDTAKPARQAAATQAPGLTVAVGTAGSYPVGERNMTFLEPAHTGPTGQYLDQRALLTAIWYPLAPAWAGPQPAIGPFPLVMFAPGFMQCGATYSKLLQAWASAGYVVAVVNFPRTDCQVGTAAYEPDLVNQPGDMSYVLGRLLALSAQPHDFFSGLLNPSQVAAAGQSDGGDTVAALAANACCTDRRLAAAAVLSGAEWPPMPGEYFPRAAPPMLFVQGSADTINPPWTSRQLYRADEDSARYYLDLFGADHMVPYTGTNPTEQLVVRVTLAFFDRYVLGRSGALATMTRYGNVPGIAALVSGDQLPP